MAVSVVQTTGLASVTSVAVITKPGSATDGDLLVLAINHDSAAISAGPAGWTQLTAASASASVGGKVNSALYWKHASSEPATYTANFTFAPNWSYQFVVLRGQNGSTTAIDSPVSIGSGSNAATMVAPAINISHSSSLRLIFAAELGFATGPTNFTTPAGYTDGGAQITSTVMACTSFSKQIVNQGTDPAVTASTSGNGGASPFIIFSVAIAASGIAASVNIVPHISSQMLMGAGR